MKVCLIFKSNTHDVISNILLNINYKYVHVFCSDEKVGVFENPGFFIKDRGF